MATPSLAETMALLKGAKNQFSRSAGRPVTIAEGKTTIRILQFFQNGNPKFWREVGQHWIKSDPNAKPAAVCGSIQTVYECKSPTGEYLPDRVEEAVDQAINAASNDDELKLYKSWKARKFVLVIAIVRNGANANPAPQLVQLANGAFADHVAIADTYLEQGVNVYDLNAGYDMTFERRGKGLDTEYTVMASPVASKVDANVLGNMPDIDAYIAKEYFRQGDDRKALTAIGAISGIAVSFGGPAIAGPVPTPAPRTGALTGTAARLAELASTAETPAPTPAPVPTPAPAALTPAPAPVVEEEDEDEKALRIMQERMAAKKAAKAAEEAAAKAAAAAAATPVPAAPAPAAAKPAEDDFGASIDADDLAATMAELDKL